MARPGTGSRSNSGSPAAGVRRHDRAHNAERPLPSLWRRGRRILYGREGAALAKGSRETIQERAMSDLTNVIVGIVLIVVGAIWGILLIPGVTDRLPRLKAPRLQPAPGGLRKRLKQDTFALVADLQAYVHAHPQKSTIESMMDARRTALIEDEDQAAAEYLAWMRPEQDRRDKEGQELTEQFAGRLNHVLAGYRKLDMVDDEAVRHMRWKLKTTFFTQELVADLDGLWRRL
jgi:hypothetical protein